MTRVQERASTSRGLRPSHGKEHLIMVALIFSAGRRGSWPSAARAAVSERPPRLPCEQVEIWAAAIGSRMSPKAGVRGGDSCVADSASRRASRSASRVLPASQGAARPRVTLPQRGEVLRTPARRGSPALARARLVFFSLNIVQSGVFTSRVLSRTAFFAEPVIIALTCFFFFLEGILSGNALSFSRPKCKVAPTLARHSRWPEA